MGKVFCSGTPSHLQPQARAAAAATFNLYDACTGVSTLGDGSRTATSAEARAYLDWCAKRAGVVVPTNAEYHEAGIYCREAKAIIVPMPGYGADPAVIMETTDEAGQVVRTSRIGVDRKGAIGLKVAAVRAACALPKVSKPRVTKARKPVAAAPVEVTPAPVAAAADTALLARLEALEAIVARLSRPVAAGKRVRTEAERRAILRAWRMRGEMRERADLDARALQAANAANLALREERERLQWAIAEDAETIATTARTVVTLSERRIRTAARMIQARAERRTAQREARGMAAGLAVAQSQLARLQPLADALAALVPPAAVPTGDNVVALHAAA